MRKVKCLCRLIWKKKRTEGDGRYSVEFTLYSDALLTSDLLTKICNIHGRTRGAKLLKTNDPIVSSCVHI